MKRFFGGFAMGEMIILFVLQFISQQLTAMIIASAAIGIISALLALLLQREEEINEKA
jgi:hypothetical protein